MANDIFGNADGAFCRLKQMCNGFSDRVKDASMVEAEVRLQSTKPFAEGLAPFTVFVFRRTVDQISAIVRVLDQLVDQASDLRVQRHEPITCRDFVVHPHKLGAGVGINANVGRLKAARPLRSERRNMQRFGWRRPMPRRLFLQQPSSSEPRLPRETVDEVPPSLFSGL
jgi:hypothetical protein